MEEGTPVLRHHYSLSSQSEIDRISYANAEKSLQFQLKELFPNRFNDENPLSNTLEKWLNTGHIVIANRYASANQIHQGGKISNPKKREAFISWLADMEYGVFKIPKPDVVFYLNLPMAVVFRLIKERNKKSVRNYLGSKKDLVEKDKNYMENSHKSALWLSKTQKNWIKIECMKGGVLNTRENIHQEIYEKVKKIIK